MAMVRGSQAVAVAEALFGGAVVVAPGLMVSLLFGIGLPDTLQLAIRFAGIGLVAFALACLRYRLARSLLIYSAGALGALAVIGVLGGPTGILLWPAVGVHVIATIALAREVRTADKGR